MHGYIGLLRLEIKLNPSPCHSWIDHKALTAWLGARQNLWWVDATGAAANSFVDLCSAWACRGDSVSSDAISEVRRLEIGGRGYYAKLYRQPGKSWRRWLGRSRCRAEWENLLLFRAFGLPVPALAAYGEQWNADGYRGVLVTTELAGTAGLDALIEPLRQRVWRESVMGQLARCLAVMHDHGFAHGDLNWRNVLVTTDGEPRIFCIDCPAGRCWPWPLRAAKITKDLWMLDKLGRRYLSRSQRLCFYKLYRGVRYLDAADKRRLRHIVAKQS